MRTIWKYPLAITDRQRVALPMGYTLLHVSAQSNTLYVWAEVDTSVAMQKTVDFYIVGTGTPVPTVKFCTVKYFGTVPMLPYVWHVYYCEDTL
jgi:hypothetical protein